MFPLLCFPLSADCSSGEVFIIILNFKRKDFGRFDLHALLCFACQWRISSTPALSLTELVAGNCVALNKSLLSLAASRLGSFPRRTGCAKPDPFARARDRPQKRKDNSHPRTAARSSQANRSLLPVEPANEPLQWPQ